MKALFYVLVGFFTLTSVWLFFYSTHYYFMLVMHLKSVLSIKTSKDKELSLPDELPKVTIQLPIFNEMLVAERLIKKVSEIDYPKDKLEIQVLDDSTDETTIITKNAVNEYKELGYNIKWYHRKIRTGYKGGALKEALAKSEGEFVAIFDADFLPPRNFLKKTIPHFTDKKVGMVQGRWTFTNPNYSFLTKIQKLALDGHFILEQKGRFLAGHYFSFNGSAGIWRKETIYDAGDWNGDTLTEDLDLSYRAQFNGWKFKYLNDLEVPSELPVVMAGYKSQQFRWAKGFIQCMKKLVGPVMKNKGSLYKKQEALVHLTSHFSYFVMAIHLILSLPMVLLMKDFGDLIKHPTLFFFLSFIMLFGMSAPLIFLMVAQKSQGTSIFKTILKLPIVFFMNFGLVVHVTKAVWEGLIGKKSGFIRTPKFNINNDHEKSKMGRKYKSTLDLSTIIELIAIAYALFVMILSIHYKIYFTTGLTACYVVGLSIIAFTTLIQNYKMSRKKAVIEEKKSHHVQWVNPEVTAQNSKSSVSKLQKEVEM